MPLPCYILSNAVTLSVWLECPNTCYCVWAQKVSTRSWCIRQNWQWERNICLTHTHWDAESEMLQQDGYSKELILSARGQRDKSQYNSTLCKHGINKPAINQTQMKIEEMAVNTAISIEKMFSHWVCVCVCSPPAELRWMRRRSSPDPSLSVTAEMTSLTDAATGTLIVE